MAVVIIVLMSWDQVVGDGGKNYTCHDLVIVESFLALNFNFGISINHGGFIYLE